VEDQYLLYYGASLMRLPDVGHPVPEYTGLAKARTIDDFFEPLPEPILGPGKNDPRKNLSADPSK